jgi:hypothetical protein
METRSCGAGGQSQPRRDLRQRRFVDVLSNERLARIRGQLGKRSIQQQRKLFTFQVNLEIESTFSRRKLGLTGRNVVIYQRDQPQGLAPLPSPPRPADVARNSR